MDGSFCSEVLAPTLVSLYLRGLPRSLAVTRQRWWALDALLRSQIPEASERGAVLRRAGFDAEALVVEEIGVWEDALRLLAEGRVATPCEPGYPRRWLDRLGASAPPAVWVRDLGECRPWVAVVGSRRIGPAEREFAAEVAGEAAALGHGVISGGAAGTDRAALDAVPACALEVLPCGLGVRAPSGISQISVCAPDEPFSTGTAMERNALVYAAAEVAVVVSVQHRQGGTWHGAADALRRRLVRVGVRCEPSSPGASALMALGAVPMSVPADLGELLTRPHSGLFGTM